MPPPKPTLLWSKLASAKWEDAWVERLRHIPPAQLVIHALHGSRRIRIEAYGLNKRDATLLTKTFGGTVRTLKNHQLIPKQPDPPPLIIRGRLAIVRSEAAAKKLAKPNGARRTLVIPAAMAFGTGDHATTSTCLRMICDIAPSLPPGWQALDLGAGTGILAMAARVLGATRCDAWDYDPACIRAIRGNTRLNALTRIPAARVDVTQWTPTRQWDLVTANLFADLLIPVAPRIAAAVAPGGRLILSGMLATQRARTLKTFRALGFRFSRVVTRGKWTTALSAPRS